MAIIYHGPPWITIQYWQLLPQVGSQPMNLVYHFTPWGWQYQSLIVNAMGRIYYVSHSGWHRQLIDCQVPGSDVLCRPVGLVRWPHSLSNPWVGYYMCQTPGVDKMCITHVVAGWSNYSVTCCTDIDPMGPSTMEMRAPVCPGSECVKHRNIIFIQG